MRNFWIDTGIFLLLLLSGGPSFTQPAGLSLREAYKMAEKVHPLFARSDLLRQEHRLKMEVIDVGRSPVVELNAEGRFQSENVSLPFEIPGQPVIELPLLSAQAAIEGRYLLYDGGQTEARRQLENAGLQAELHGVEADLYETREQVNRAFFGTLLLRAQVGILQNSLANLESKIEELAARVRQGVVLPGSVNKLRIEALRLESRIKQGQGDIQGQVRTLSELTGTELDTAVQLVVDRMEDLEPSAALQRPELRFFSSRRSAVLAREELLAAERRPVVSTFARAGFGYPNPLNFFDENLSPFGLVGVRLNWKVFDWGKIDKERQLLTVRSRLIENQESVFRHQLEVQQHHFLENISTLEALIARDEEILRLQEAVLEQASAQLARGVITSSEYLDEVNAQIRAKLNLEQHRLQLQQAKVNYLTIKGRY